MATTLHHDGLADIKALAKYRLFRDNFGPTDTRRFDAIAGLEVRSGDSGVTSDFYDPAIGGVFNWMIEAGVQLPVLQELNHCPERDYELVLSFRLH